MMFDVRDYGANDDGIEVTAASITQGSAVLTCAGAAFAPTDVGKLIIVDGAGDTYHDPGDSPLVTTIASWQSSTQVTLAAAADNTVNAGSAIYGTDSTPGCRAACEAANDVGGGTVFLPRTHTGQYLLQYDTAHVIEAVPSGTPTAYAIGLYSHTTITQDPAVTIHCPFQDILWDHQCAPVTNVDPDAAGFIIERLRLFGRFTAPTYERGYHYGILVLNACKNFRIFDNEIWGFSGKHIHLESQTDSSKVLEKFWVERNYLHSSGAGNGITLAYGAKDGWICDNVVSDSLKPGHAEALGFSSGVFTNVNWNGNVSRKWGNMAFSGNAVGCDFDDNTIEGWGTSSGIQMSAASIVDCSVSHNTVDMTSQAGSTIAYGIQLPAENKTCRNLTIADNTILLPATTKSGIRCTNQGAAVGLHVDDNRVYGGGINVGAGTPCSYGCSADGNFVSEGTISLSAASGAGGSVSGNVNVGTSGILVSVSGGRIHVEKNVLPLVNHSAAWAIWVRGADNQVVSNKIAGVFQRGIYLGATAARTLLAGNKISGAGVPVFEDPGADHSVLWQS